MTPQPPSTSASSRPSITAFFPCYNDSGTIASVVIKELIRRKDFYVLFVLTMLRDFALGLAQLAYLIWPLLPGRKEIAAGSAMLVPLTAVQRATLVALRAATLVALVLFLFRPVALQPPAGARDAIVPVLVDVSRSMRVVDADGQSAPQEAHVTSYFVALEGFWMTS